MYSWGDIKLRDTYSLLLVELQRPEHTSRLLLLKLAPLSEELRTPGYTIMVILKEYIIFMEGSLKLGGWQNVLSAVLKCSLQGLHLGMNLMRMHSIFKGIMLLMEVKVLGISTEVIGGRKCWLFNISICNMTCSLFWKTALKDSRTVQGELCVSHLPHFWI